MTNIFLQPHIMAAFSKEDILKFIQDAQSVGLKGSDKILATVGRLNDPNSNIVDAIQEVMKLVNPVAFAMLMIFFAIGVIEDAQQKGGEVDMKSFVKAGIGLIVGTMFIQVSPHIVGRLIALNDALVVGSTELAEIKATAKINTEDMSSYNIITLLFLAAMSVVSVIPQLIAMLIIMISVFSAKIEVALRLAFAPLGLAGFASDSGRHSAIRYFRKLVASMLYMFGIGIVLYITLQIDYGSVKLINDPKNTGIFLVKWLMNLEEGFMKLAVPFAAIGAITAMKGVINEALGA